jgi:hypothetical protein
LDVHFDESLFGCDFVEVDEPDPPLIDFLFSLLCLLALLMEPSLSRSPLMNAFSLSQVALLDDAFVSVEPFRLSGRGDEQPFAEAGRRTGAED